MTAQVKAWGNSQGIRLPRNVLEELDLHLDDYISIEIINGKLVIEKITAQEHKHKTLEERIAMHGGKLGPYDEFDWGAPVGREW